MTSLHVAAPAGLRRTEARSGIKGILSRGEKFHDGGECPRHQGFMGVRKPQPPHTGT